MARELKRRGFQFIGPTTAYSLMEAAGLVNDHLDGCEFRTPGEGMDKVFVRAGFHRRSTARPRARRAAPFTRASDSDAIDRGASSVPKIGARSSRRLTADGGVG
jgi:hypothetical protein